jgi:hypothetical protein
MAAAFAPLSLSHSTKPNDNWTVTLSRRPNQSALYRAGHPKQVTSFLLALALAANPPTKVQHRGIADNPGGIGIDGNDFQITLPGPVQAGNVLILGVAFCSRTSANCTTIGNDLCHPGGGCTIPVDDNNGNTWPTSPAVRVNDANSNVDMAIFVLPNAAAGPTAVTVHFTAALRPFTAELSEFFNVATSSPVEVTAGASNVAAPTVTTSISPTVDGELIWVMARDDDSPGSGNQVTTWAPAASFTLLDADIGWDRDANAHKAAAYFVQGSHAALNAGFTATMSPANDHYVMAAVALKSAKAGSAAGPGIRILTQLGNTNETPPASWTLQFPSQGNLLVAICTTESGHMVISSITDNHSNTWTRVEPDASEPQLWYAANATSANDLQLTLTVSGGTIGSSWTLFDIAGATTSPLDVTAGTTATAEDNVDFITDFPSITPSAATGMTISALTIGQGPGLAVNSPDGAQFDLIHYTGELDTDTINNADGVAHVINSGGATEHWNWTITPQPNNQVSAVAARFKQAFRADPHSPRQKSPAGPAQLMGRPYSRPPMP